MHLTRVSTGVWKGQACVCFHIAFNRLPFMMDSLFVSLQESYDSFFTSGYLSCRVKKLGANLNHLPGYPGGGCVGGDHIPFFGTTFT